MNLIIKYVVYQLKPIPLSIPVQQGLNKVYFSSVWNAFDTEKEALEVMSRELTDIQGYVILREVNSVL